MTESYHDPTVTVAAPGPVMGPGPQNSLRFFLTDTVVVSPTKLNALPSMVTVLDPGPVTVSPWSVLSLDTRVGGLPSIVTVLAPGPATLSPLAVASPINEGIAMLNYDLLFGCNINAGCGLDIV